MLGSIGKDLADVVASDDAGGDNIEKTHNGDVECVWGGKVRVWGDKGNETEERKERKEEGRICAIEINMSLGQRRNTLAQKDDCRR